MNDRAGGYTAYQFTAEFYDHVEPYRERQDVAFFVEMAQESGGPVLEVGCGTGRVLIPTARAGFEIVGLDLAPLMLAACREKLAQEPAEVQARVELVEDDMRAFDLGRQFALVTIPFRPFQHLITVADQIACLKTIHRHLKPGGRLALDLFNPSLPYLADAARLDEFGDEPGIIMPDGRRVLRRARIAARDYFNQIQDTELTYYVTYPDGRQERRVHAFPMRYLFRFEAEHLLARCGFEVEALYADYDRSPYGSKYPGELIFVARK
ncbi:MAG: class I SAM-dependent methyltransferase [Chloroflexi bacterium HGW-Chloroflexi-1]|nr:MAG: class I SAM-dependent methyltransferase [Chloroflexi bacterium HGW-Chloroflexi-1]